MEKKVKKRRSRKTSSIFMRGFLLFFLCAVTVGIVKLGVQYQDLQAEQLLLSEQIAAEKERQLEFEYQKEYYHSDSYIEQIAREQLGMVKPNEIIYVNRGE